MARFRDMNGIDGLFRCPGCDDFHVVRIGGSNPWKYNGNADRPTLEPSVLLHGNPAAPRCHSFVRDGKIQFLGDCTHALKGQTVDLPELELP